MKVGLDTNVLACAELTSARMLVNAMDLASDHVPLDLGLRCVGRRGGDRMPLDPVGGSSRRVCVAWSHQGRRAEVDDSGVQVTMDRTRWSHEARPVLSAAAVYLCTGLSIVSLFVKIGSGEITSGYWPAVMAITSPVFFLCACVVVFFRRTLGYILGGIAGLVALPWFVMTESSFFVRAWTYLPSAWVFFNGPDDFEPGARSYATLKILSAALIATAITCSLLRLLPARLSLGIPISGRTWPAIAVAVLVLAVWLYRSAMPWMLPASSMRVRRNYAFCM